MAVGNRYCPSCGGYVRSDRGQPNNVLHAVLTLLTGCFWLPVWIFCLMNQVWHCGHCGSRTYATKAGRLIERGLIVVFVGFMGLVGLLLLMSLGTADPRKLVSQPAVVPAPEPAMQNDLLNEVELPAKAELVEEMPAVQDPPEVEAVRVEDKSADDPKADQKREVKLPASDEEVAAGKLKLAKPLIGKNQTSARKRLQEIIDKYPDTPAAEEAKGLLEKL